MRKERKEGKLGIHNCKIYLIYIPSRKYKEKQFAY